MSEILTFREVCQAVAEGKQLQARGDSMPAWHDIEMDTMNYIKKSHQYRIKPEDRYEPWTFDTCPREGWIRFKRNKHIRIHRIHGIDEQGLNCYQQFINYNDLLSEGEYSLNGIDGWRPAGRRVE